MVINYGKFFHGAFGGVLLLLIPKQRPKDLQGFTAFSSRTLGSTGSNDGAWRWF